MSKRPSLTLRLGALVAGLALLVFACVGWYLYQALAQQLQQRDDMDLIERATLLRHLLAETPDADAIARDPHRFLDAASLDGGVLLLMQDSRGTVLAANTVDRQWLPQAAAPIARSVQGGDLAAARDRAGTPLRALVVGGKTADGAEIRVALARSVAERSALLAAYRQHILCAALIGTLLMAGLGYALIAGALRPVRQLAGQAADISAHNLQARLQSGAAPAELALLSDAFNAVLDRLQTSFERLSQFAADLAHDMRTPLNNLMIQTEVMLSQARSVEDYQSLLGSNHEEFQRMSRMVERMLFLARADNQEVALHCETLDLHDELQRVANYFEELAQDAGITLRVEVTGTAVCDAQLLQRAVSNLLSNALRYTAAGEVVWLQASSGERGADIAVSNPGPGIAPEHLPRLFDRFYRSEPDRPGDGVSAGLGLAIVQSIMTLHGGTATVTSTPGGITTFLLHFPPRAL